jgi:hypothetical protein
VLSGEHGSEFVGQLSGRFPCDICQFHDLIIGQPVKKDDILVVAVHNLLTDDSNLGISQFNPFVFPHDLAPVYVLNIHCIFGFMGQVLYKCHTIF